VEELMEMPNVRDLSENPTIKAMIDAFCETNNVRRIVIVACPALGIYRVHEYPERSPEDA
jgi:hypothetical protein